MRALVYQHNELVLDHNYPMPTPVNGEALLRVLHAGICNTDLEIVRGYLGFQGVLGHEFVAIVEEIYGDSTREQYGHLIGKRVVGEINTACRRPDCFACRNAQFTHCPKRTTIGIVDRNGAFADYLTLPVENLQAVPEQVSDEEAVFVEPLAANFEIVEQVHCKPTDKILILGDGKLGQLAALVLTLNGCNVSMIGKHTEKLALAEKCGVHPYLLQEGRYLQFERERQIDLVVECTGSAQGLEMALRLVRPRGTVIFKSTVADKSLLNLAPIVIDEIRVQGSRCGPFAPALHALHHKLIAVRPLIHAHYTLEESIAAFQHAAQQGVLKVLVQI